MPHRTTTIYLVRHAHAHWTPDEMRALSPAGSKAAEELAEYLATYPITHIVSSDSLRARQTVTPLAKRLGLSISLEPDLRERRLTSSILSTGICRDTESFHDAVRATWQNPCFAYPGGESNAAAQARGVSALQRLIRAHPGDHIILGTHGNLLTLILQHFDPLIGFDFWVTLTMPDVVILKVDNDNHGEFCHPEWSHTTAQ